MSRNLRLGASSIAFSKPLYIESAASIVSQKEADGPLGDFFDLVCEDPMFGCDTWESAESTLQKETATLAMNKAGLNSEDIHLMFAGDLLAQTAATCFGSAGLGIPFYGLYGACSTMGESLSLGCIRNQLDCILCHALFIQSFPDTVYNGLVGMDRITSTL